MNATLRRQNNEAELEAFEVTCQRLAGFDPALSFERVDGLLCALAAGPRRLTPQEWLPALFDDTWERVFADPDDHAQALRALQARLSVLYDQLDPEALFDDPDALRLDPLVAVWTEEERQQFIEDAGLDDEAAARLQIGREWARGFLDGVDRLPALWVPPPDEEAAALFAEALEQVVALMLDADSDALRAHVEKYYAKDRPSSAGEAEMTLPTRDELLAEAVDAVQCLRVYWVDYAPRPDARRVEAAPGRNDPCPCGSGKKYKKCHGASAP